MANRAPGNTLPTNSKPVANLASIVGIPQIINDFVGRRYSHAEMSQHLDHEITLERINAIRDIGCSKGATENAMVKAIEAIYLIGKEPNPKMDEVRIIDVPERSSSKMILQQEKNHKSLEPIPFHSSVIGSDYYRQPPTSFNPVWIKKDHDYSFLNNALCIGVYGALFHGCFF